jgi:hypothetical protein
MRALEKDPELRFQTAGDLRSSCRRLARDYVAKEIGRDREISGAPIATPPPAESGIPAKPLRSTRRWLFAAQTAVAIAAGFAVFSLTRAIPPLRVTHLVQITTDGLTKRRMVNDGARLYYAAGNRDSEMKMFQVSL